MYFLLSTIRMTIIDFKRQFEHPGLRSDISSHVWANIWLQTGQKHQNLINIQCWDELSIRLM